MTRFRAPALVALTAVATAVLVVPSCSGGDDGADGTADTGAGDAGGHDMGSSMTPETMSVDDIAATGDGPEVGDRWSGWVGLNVCGRFLELPADDVAVDGISVAPTGRFTVAPETGDPTGHDVDVAALLDRLGARAATGEMSLSAAQVPPAVEFPGGEVTVAGTTFRTGDPCGESPGEVQLWWYPPEAVDTGEGIGIVVTDPQDVPITADGSAITLAFVPESSLPTLPPAALLDPAAEESGA